MLTLSTGTRLREEYLAARGEYENVDPREHESYPDYIDRFEANRLRYLNAEKALRDHLMRGGPIGAGTLAVPCRGGAL